MADVGSGITDLYGQLVDRFLPNERRPCQPFQSRSDKIKKKKAMYARTYDILLFKSRIKAHDQNLRRDGSAEELGPVNQILSHVFTLRWERKFDSASQLENSLNRIKDTANEDDTVRNMLSLILKLAGSTPKTEEYSQMPIVCHSSKSRVLLPTGPLSYGDSRVWYTDTPHYTMYPSQCFKPKLKPLHRMTDFDFSLLKALPGVGVSKFFSNEEPKTNNNNSRTLFGALVQSKARAVSPWTKLDLPSIEDGNGRLQIRIPCISPTLTDEGLQTGNDSSSTLTDSSITDCWTEALKLPPTQQKQAWDSGSSRQPYLTDCGLEALNHLYWYNQDLMATVDCTYVPVRQLYVTVTHLLRDVHYLLMGLPSRIFLFDQPRQEFRVRQGICISGTTPEALCSLLEPFLECGSLFYRLEGYSIPPLLNSFYTKGLVFQAFTTWIRKYLRFYEAFVLSLKESSLLALLDRCHYVFKQVRFLAELCRISMTDLDRSEQVPTGLKLLSYIHEHTLSSTATENYRLLLSVLKTTAVPYVNFVQRWVYHGVCEDPYEEFMIRVNNDFLFCRDKHYWGHGYELIELESDLDRSMPLFLNEIMSEIYNCGRAINLLKLCCPDHFLCNVPMNDVPKLSITYDASELERIQVRTGAYVSRVEEVTRQSLISRKELLQREERTRFDLIQKGRQVAHERTEAARAERVELIVAIQAKKRKELFDLKLGMEKDQERRKEMIEQQKAEDKALMESVKDKGKQKTALELRLEEQAKEELIEHYERMTAKALLRERRALWKIERAKLTLERNSMLREEETELKEEHETFLANEKAIAEAKLEEEKFDTENNDDVVESDDDDDDDDVILTVNDVDGLVVVDNLLDITAAAATSQTTSVVDVGRNLLDMTVPDVGPGGLLDTTLPKWAQTDVTKMVTEDREMPVWAQKGIANETPVIVLSKPEENGSEDRYLTGRTGNNESETTAASSELTKPIRRAMEQSEESEQKSSIRSVSGRHIGQTNFSFSETSEPYEFTVPNLRPIEEILSESMADTSFEICRRTSIYSPVKKQENKKDGESEKNRAEKFKQSNTHGSHPSQTSEEQISVIPTRGKPSKITEESAPEKEGKSVRFKEQNVHGHASDARIKIQDGSGEMKYTTEKQESFKSNREETLANYNDLQMKQVHVSDESTGLDLNALRIERFHQHNLRGHKTRGAKSSVQKLLYGETFGALDGEDPNGNSARSEEEIAPKFKLSPLPWLDSGVEEYRDSYDEVDDDPNFDMATRVYRSSWTYRNADAEDTSAQRHISLPIMIKRSFVSPILAQISLTNRSLVTYFFQNLMVDRHFEALKLFMFLEDGEFGQTLGDIMFEKLAHDPLPHEVFNTVFLSGALRKALRASNIASNMNEYLMFGNKYLPKAGEMNGPRALDCLELHYQINWPLNIVITDSCLLRYNMIFCFMLQLKRVAWCLNDIWYRLKRDALSNFGADLCQFRTLQLYRHEMQNFVRVVQSYLSNQIIHVSWGEFQRDLMDNVRTLDDLHDVHANYLNKAIFRCLLSKKAGSMMKVIQDILALILRFHSQLLSAGWQRDGNKASHPGYVNMQKTYRSFRDYSMFLFKVIRKVTARGYQPHLEELLLRLNFNDYYTNRQRMI